MEDFYDILANLGLVNTINPVTYSKPVFVGEEKVYDFLNDIVDNNKKVLIYGDYDPDGLMSLLSVRDSFKYIKFSNYEVFKYRKRTHSLDSYAAFKAIEEKFDYIIVCDAGSSDMDMIKKLIYFNVRVILLDHHKTKYKYEDYPENCAIVNTTLENKILHDDVYRLSAGALTYIIMRAFTERRTGSHNKSISAYATISLYADCIDMSSSLNRSIYYESIALDDLSLPMYIQHFLQGNMKFCRRFIEYQFTPKVNSVFRSENFELINKYFLEEDAFVNDIHIILEKMIEVYENARDMIAKCADIIEHQVLDNFVIGNLSSVDYYLSVEENKLQNYTGLVANKLSDRYGKTAIVYANAGTYIKGSLRDLYSRDYLTLFQQFCDSQGHSAAFGIKLNYLDFNEFLDYIQRVDKKFFIQTVPNSPIILSYNVAEPDSKLLTDMSIYNEFSGNDIPIALLEKKLVGALPEVTSRYSSKFYTNYKWGNYYIQSPSKIPFGSNMLIKPIKSKSIKLLVYDAENRGDKLG